MNVDQGEVQGMGYSEDTLGMGYSQDTLGTLGMGCLVVASILTGPSGKGYKVVASLLPTQLTSPNNQPPRPRSPPPTLKAAGMRGFRAAPETPPSRTRQVLTPRAILRELTMPLRPGGTNEGTSKLQMTVRRRLNEPSLIPQSRALPLHEGPKM